MNKIIVIGGPTATSKTKLSLILAKELNGEIINYDSTQVYKGLYIATAKEKDTQGIIHHIYNKYPLDKGYTVYDFQKEARNIIADILKRGKTPILVGGTGLYIKACLYDYEFTNKDKKEYSKLTLDELYNKVISLDENNKIHKNNRPRLENALAYMEETNLKYSDKVVTDKLSYPAIFIGLELPRPILYEFINKRVDNMIKEGLIEEAKELYDKGYYYKSVMTPIGYKELYEYFEGNISLEESIELIKKRSRNYAKRQLTWYKNKMDFKWFNVDYENYDKTKKEVLDYIN